MASLEFLRRSAERHMRDRCRITRDAEGADDDTFDRTTGLLIRPAGEPSTVYEGRVLLYPADRRAQIDTEGGRVLTEQPYVAAVPLKAPQPNVGDEIVFLSSRDPRAVGRTFRVVEVLSSSFAVSREMRLEERVG